MSPRRIISIWYVVNGWSFAIKNFLEAVIYDIKLLISDPVQYSYWKFYPQKSLKPKQETHLTLKEPIPQNGQTHSNNSSAICPQKNLKPKQETHLNLKRIDHCWLKVGSMTKDNECLTYIQWFCLTKYVLCYQPRN